MSRRRRSRASSTRDPNAWNWPEALEPLKGWLALHNVDVHAVKTARQALYFGLCLSRKAIRYPPKGQEIEALVKLQLALTGKGPMKITKHQSVSYGRRRGTFGPASEVRVIDPSSYPLPKDEKR